MLRSRDELLRVIAAQQRQPAEQELQIAELRATVTALQAEVERLKRASPRQAAPFSEGTHVTTPQKAGRKPGKGLFRSRVAPEAASLTEPPIEVAVTLRACPACGGRLVVGGVEDASVTELPTAVRPHVRRFRVAVCRCTGCGRRVRGQHPESAPDQYGATAHRVGGRVMAAAHVLH